MGPILKGIVALCLIVWTIAGIVFMFTAVSISGSLAKLSGTTAKTGIGTSSSQTQTGGLPSQAPPGGGQQQSLPGGTNGGGQQPGGGPSSMQPQPMPTR